MELYTLFFVVLFFSSVNAGLYLVGEKWGLVEYYALYRKNWMPQCTFCLYFWMAVTELYAWYTYHVFASDLPFDFFFILTLTGCCLSSAVISRYLTTYS